MCFSTRKILTLRLRMFLYPDFIFNLTAAGRKQKENINILHSFINKVNIVNINNELILTYILYLLI